MNVALFIGGVFIVATIGGCFAMSIVKRSAVWRRAGYGVLLGWVLVGAGSVFWVLSGRAEASDDSKMFVNVERDVRLACLNEVELKLQGGSVAKCHKAHMDSVARLKSEVGEGEPGRMVERCVKADLEQAHVFREPFYRNWRVVAKCALSGGAN